jgi:hypothetical protein
VQRWELSEQLPIHRQEHRQRATAYAFTGELDEWMVNRAPSLTEDEAPEAAPRFGSRRPRRIVLMAAGLLAVVVAAVFIYRGIPGRPPDSGSDSKDPQAYAAFVEGLALYQSRQYSDAAVSLERAVSQDRNYGTAWAWLAKTYARLAQPVWSGGKAAGSRADEAARRAALLAPLLPETHVALALAAPTSTNGGRRRIERSNSTRARRKRSGCLVTPIARSCMPATATRTRSWPKRITGVPWNSRRT